MTVPRTCHTGDSSDLLFLDVDGVLHPVGTDYSFSSRFFSHLPLLEELLREFSSVDVIISSDYQQLFWCQSADILVAHEAPAAHPHGWQAIDELAKALGARLLVHGHHHENIDYVAQGLMDANAARST